MYIYQMYYNVYTISVLYIIVPTFYINLDY